LIGLLVSVAGSVTLSSISWPAISVLSAPQTLPLLPIAIVAGCWLVLAPIALYYAFSRD
jgi:hypothetical protein